MASIGIDLGTTNSLISYWTEDGPRLIPNALGKHITPSVVSIDDNGEILVGEIAKERLITHPHLTASNFKRNMGTKKIYTLGDKHFTSTDLSSLVLRSLKNDAQAHLGEEITEAVISVPAYFNDTQRKATKQAALLAGLNVQRLISEPTAAAIAYGLNQDDDCNILVFDLGGGTFDVSILELFDGIMQVRAVSGNNHLGGEDFTRILLNYFIDKNNIDINAIDNKTMSILRKKAEDCKKALTSNDLYNMTTTIDSIEYSTTITTKLFEDLSLKLINELVNPMAKALRDADITTDELDSVILIGGATRMPMIKSTTAKLFKKYPFSDINPDETVALGAAIQSALKDRNEALKEIVLTDVCPYTLGISVIDEIQKASTSKLKFSPIIERNSPIPISRSEVFSTAYDCQEKLRVSVYQGESRIIDNNMFLGDLMVEVPKNMAGHESIDVRFTYDINGLLEVEVTSLSTKEVKSMVINNSNNEISEEALNERKKVLSQLKIHPRERAENRLLLAKANRLYEECLGELREYISDLISKFEATLHSQDEDHIRDASISLADILEQIESSRRNI